MINSRILVVDPSVVAYCNSHKGPMIIASPDAIVAQVTNLLILDSLLYTVVVCSKSFVGSYRLSLRWVVLGCITGRESLGRSGTYFFISEQILQDFVSIYKSPERRLGLLDNSDKITPLLDKRGLLLPNGTSAVFEPVFHVIHLKFRRIRERFKRGMIQQEPFCGFVSFLAYDWLQLGVENCYDNIAADVRAHA